MPVAEPRAELLPDVRPEERRDQPTIPLDQLRETMQMAKITFETGINLPQTAESMKEVAEDFEPVARTLLNAVISGDVTLEDAVEFLKKDRANTVEVGNMDDLSETYRRDYLEKRLNRMITQLKPGHTVKIHFYDLVNFKNVNDTLTQKGGNRVLREAARQFKQRHPTGTGGRIGDEYVFFEIVPQIEAQLADLEEQTDMPDKLMDIQVRGSSIPVYIHKGVAFYDKELDKTRIEEHEVNGEKVKEVITPAKSAINRANSIADENKAKNKASHPELYLGRHEKIGEPELQ